MEVPRLGVESELQLPAYTTATATRDPNLVFNLHHSSWQCWILNPRGKARDRTCVLMDASQNSHNTVLLTVVTKLYISSPGLIAGSLYLLTPFTHVTYSPYSTLIILTLITWFMFLHCKVIYVYLITNL